MAFRNSRLGWKVAPDSVENVSSLTTGPIAESGVELMVRFALAVAVALACSSCGPSEGHAAGAGRFDPVIELLRSTQFTVTSLEDEPSASCVELLNQIKGRSPGAEPQVVMIDQSLQVILAEHAEVTGAAAYLEWPQVYLAIGDVDLVPVDGDLELWQQLISNLHKRGARYVERNRMELVNVLATLEMVHLQIEQFQYSYKWRYPDFKKGWKDLVKPGYFLEEPPRNGLADRAVASKVVVIDTKGASGATVSLKTAGWVWNSVDLQFLPAGWTGDQLRKTIAQSPQELRFSDPRRSEVKEILGEFRASIAGFAIESGPRGQGRYPTLDEINTAGFVRGSSASLTNPFKGSRAIQAAQWNPADPPVSGAAGWNYDAGTGKIWPNSDVTGERDF
jgi:hypothetical protein